MHPTERALKLTSRAEISYVSRGWCFKMKERIQHLNTGPAHDSCQAHFSALSFSPFASHISFCLLCMFLLSSNLPLFLFSFFQQVWRPVKVITFALLKLQALINFLSASLHQICLLAFYGSVPATVAELLSFVPFVSFCTDLFILFSNWYIHWIPVSSVFAVPLSVRLH